LDLDISKHANQLNAAVQHLEAHDVRFIPLVQKFGPPRISVSKNLFLNLIKSIVYQQLAGAAAHRIFIRFLGLFFPNNPVDEKLAGSFAFAEFFNDETRALSPTAVKGMDIQKLRDIGLSMRKAEYVQGLALAVSSGKLDLDNIRTFPDDLVSQQVTSVRGLGPWTSDMFKMVIAPQRQSIHNLHTIALRPHTFLSFPLCRYCHS
jgi:DNA-3-methyladenine glycosylase II